MKSEGSKFKMFAAAACLFALGLAGCKLRGQSSVEPTGAPAAAAVSATPTAEPPPAAEPSSTPAPAPSFEAVTYRDATNGFELDHPASWVVGPTQQQSRGGITAFTSWDRPIDEPPGMTPPGETRMDVTVQLWDPAGDLDAFLGQRHIAWDASGIAVISEERWTLVDNRAAAAFGVEGSDGAQAYFFFTTIGDRYLVLSGDGDLALLSEIAHTVRPAPLEY